MRKLKRFAIVCFSIGAIGIAADVIQNYILLRVAQNWLQTSEKRQHSFKSHLNVFPLGGATVQIEDLVSVEGQEKLTVNKIVLRKGLFEFNEVKVLATGLTLGKTTADGLKGVAQKIQNEVGTALVFKELELDNLSFSTPVLVLKTPKISGEALYKVNEKTISFALNSPKILMDEKETVGLDVKGDLTIHTPRDGELVFKVKNIDELSHTLVQAGYLNSNQAQILIFGGQLLGDEDGQVKVKLKFKKGDVYWGPVKLKL